jgi:integrase
MLEESKPPRASCCGVVL